MKLQRVLRKILGHGHYHFGNAWLQQYLCLKGLITYNPVYVHRVQNVVHTFFP